MCTASVPATMQTVTTVKKSQLHLKKPAFEGIKRQRSRSKCQEVGTLNGKKIFSVQPKPTFLS